MHNIQIKTVFLLIISIASFPLHATKRYSSGSIYDPEGHHLKKQQKKLKKDQPPIRLTLQDEESQKCLDACCTGTMAYSAVCTAFAAVWLMNTQPK
jgi:hypothetical protein